MTGGPGVSNGGAHLGIRPPGNLKAGVGRQVKWFRVLKRPGPGDLCLGPSYLWTLMLVLAVILIHRDASKPP